MRNTTIKRIGLNRKKPEMLGVVYMLFCFYVVQVILQKNLVLCENARNCDNL